MAIYTHIYIQIYIQRYKYIKNIYIFTYKRCLAWQQCIYIYMCVCVCICTYPFPVFPDQVRSSAQSFLSFPRDCALPDGPKSARSCFHTHSQNQEPKVLGSKHWDFSALSRARMLKTIRGPDVLGSCTSKTLGPLSTFALQSPKTMRGPNVLRL